MKKRSLWLIICPCFLLLIVLFHKPLICFAIKTHIQKKLSLRHISIDYDKLSFDGRRLAFNHLRLSQPNFEDQLIAIEQLTFDFKGLSLSPFLFAKGMTVHVFKMDSFLDLSHFNIHKTLSKLRPSFDIVIQQGRVICHLNKEKSKTFYFEYYPGKNEGHLGDFHFYFDQEQKMHSPCQVGLYISHHEVLTKLKMDQLKLIDIQPFFDFFSVRETDIILSKGMLDGEVHLGIAPQNIIQYFKADLQCMDFFAERKDKNDRLFFDILKVSAYLPLDIQRNFSLSELSLPLILKQVTFASDIVNGHYCFLNRVTHNYWEIKNFYGKTHFKLELSPTVSFSGDIMKDGDEYPFELTAKGLIESEKNWWLDLDLAMGRMPQKTHTNIFLTLLEDSTMYAKAFLKELKASQLKMFQDLIQVKVPSVEKIILEEAKVSTDLHLMLNSNEIKMLLFDHIKIADLKGFIRDDLHTCFTCDDLEGRIHLHFPIGSQVDALFSNVRFENVQISELINNKRYQLSNLSGEINLEKSCLNKSFIEGVFEGIHSQINFEGPFEKLKMSFNCRFSDKHILSEFENKVLAVSDKIAPLKQLEGVFLINLNTKPSIDGSLGFSFPEKCKEDMSFHINAPDIYTLFYGLKNFNSHGINGWFKSENITENTYLWALLACDQKWWVSGQIGLDGSFDDRTLKFKASSIKPVFYDSDDISVWIEANRHQEVSGDFSFDLSLFEWDIQIPLNRAKVLDKKFQLYFEKVICDLKIKKTQLFAQNISAFCDNVYFQGCLDLNFRNKDWLELNIYPKHAEGTSEDFQKFLRHFPEFKTFDVPINGMIKTQLNNYIHTCYNNERSEQNSRYSFVLEDATFNFSKTSQFSHLNCEIVFDSSTGMLEIKDLKADLDLIKESFKKNYQLNVQNLIFQVKDHKFCNFDIRLESKTYDILRLLGRVDYHDNNFSFDVDKNLSHFFNCKFSEFNLELDENFKINSYKIESIFNLADIGLKLSLLDFFGFLSLPESFFKESLHDRTQGEMNVSLSFDKKSDHTHIEAFSDEMTVAGFPLKKFYFQAEKNHNQLTISQCRSNKFKLFMQSQKEGDVWHIPLLEYSFENIHSKVIKGIFDPQLIKLTGELKNFVIPLNFIKKMINLPETFEKVQGDICLSGNMDINFSEDFSSLNTDLYIQCHSILKLSEELFFLKSKSPFRLTLNSKKRIVFKDLAIELKHHENQLLSSIIECKKFHIDVEGAQYEAKHAMLTIPPEMLAFLCQHHFLSHIQIKDNKFSVFSSEFSWDNQIQTEFDFHIQKGRIFFEGILKDGYYWIGSKSVFLGNFHYQLENEKLITLFGFDYLDLSLDVFARFDFKEKFNALISLKEGHLSEEKKRDSLDIQCKYSQEEGFSIQAIDGLIYGLDFSFHKNPRSYVPHVMILSGQIKIDSSGLVKAFPKLFYQTCKDLGMGSGYELSGDWMISKKDLKNSYFKGFLKGRDFEFLGFQFKTLLSELDINAKQIQVREFSLSDQSGVMHLKELKIAKSEEDGSWEMSIPEIVVQDFRPCFLKKNTYEQEQIKPFVIKDLHFFNIQGTLGYKNSFSGWGYMEFLNTFKRDYNLLDIPIEIIGRIGFDLGLFVPVKGKVEFQMDEGKIYLKELKHSYSEGKRSKFYLSSYKDSFIGLDGSIFIDIKMKQYVLLKITQPFTLSIRGNLTKPSYSLR